MTQTVDRCGGQGTPEPNPRSRVTRGPFVTAPGPRVTLCTENKIT